MPIYEFMCEKCMRITSKMLSIEDKTKIIDCEKCNSGKANRIMSVTGGHDIKGYSAKNGYSKGE